MHPIESDIVARPRLEDFLQAQIGLNRHGMPISVRSAMARQGVDPGSEADRIARLSHTAALSTLTLLIHRIVEGTWHESEVRSKAERLARLLPSSPVAAAGSKATAWPADWRPILTGVLLIVLLLVITISYWT